MGTQAFAWPISTVTLLSRATAAPPGWVHKRGPKILPSIVGIILVVSDPLSSCRTSSLCQTCNQLEQGISASLPMCIATTFGSGFEQRLVCKLSIHHPGSPTAIRHALIWLCARFICLPMVLIRWLSLRLYCCDLLLTPWSA